MPFTAVSFTLAPALARTPDHLRMPRTGRKEERRESWRRRRRAAHQTRRRAGALEVHVRGVGPPQQRRIGSLAVSGSPTARRVLVQLQLCPAPAPSRGALRSIADACSELDEQFGGVGMPFSRRPHQRGLALPGLPDVDVRAELQERLHHLDVARGRSDHERSLAIRRQRVHLGAGFQQAIDHRRAAVGARHPERGRAVAVRGLHVGPRLDQQVHRGHIVELDGPVQRRGPIGLGGVDRRRVLPDKLPNRLCVPEP